MGKKKGVPHMGHAFWLLYHLFKTGCNGRGIAADDHAHIIALGAHHGFFRDLILGRIVLLKGAGYIVGPLAQGFSTLAVLPPAFT